MKARSISEVIDSIRLKLSNLGSPISNFSTYSNIYAIFRSVAATITEQDVRLETLINSVSISNATGTYLDNKAEDFGITRHLGSVASGYVLASGPSVDIKEGVVLSLPSQALNFETTRFAKVSATEVLIPIKSTDQSEEANIFQGTQLYSNIYPTHSFIVGKYRHTLTNEPIGSLVGGSPIETDDELRKRLRDRISGDDTLIGTIAAIKKSLLQLDVISKVYIQEHTPTAGYFTVYIDTPNLESRNIIESKLNSIKPVGSLFIIKAVKQRLLDIVIQVTMLTSSNLSDVSALIEEAAQDYINKLSIGEPLIRNKLLSHLTLYTGISDIEIVAPSTDILIPKDSTISANVSPLIKVV